MRAYIIVTEHPYAAVTNADGDFVLDHVPPGRYTLCLWHERLGALKTPVSVTIGQAVSLKLLFSPQLSPAPPCQPRPQIDKSLLE
jgi:hypothetical protein